MKFENIEVFNFKGAFRGMRNPLESWDKSDSDFSKHSDFIGINDLKLAQKLIKSGTDHSKFMRQIIVNVDIAAPLYWWKEFDTYKVGTVANSTSTMHKLATTPITIECFEIGDYPTYEECCELEETARGYYFSADDLMNCMACTIEQCEDLRKAYLKTNDKRYWKMLIRLLPSSWLQKRTITMSYQNLRQMYFARKHHKLSEWSVDFISFIESLPYAKELIMVE